jgi:RHS repeat-associated protein
MVSFGSKSYSYDSRNRLISHGNYGYGYDAQNHRVSLTINGNATKYSINPNAKLSQLLEATKANGEKTIYIYGLGLLSQEINGKKLYYHYDLRGSTIALTDESGNIVDRWSYLPYGGLISHDKGNTKTPFLYNGRDGVMTDENGLYYMRARYYDPTIRRFINRDTLLGEIGKMATLNRFGYVNGNPVSGVDPSGTEVYEILDVLNYIGETFGNDGTIDARRWNGWWNQIRSKKYINKLKGAIRGIPQVLKNVYKSVSKNKIYKIAGYEKYLYPLAEINNSIEAAQCYEEPTESNVLKLRTYATIDAVTFGFVRDIAKTYYSIGNTLGLLDDEEEEYMEHYLNKNMNLFVYKEYFFDE